jgi:phosphoglycolate phosphatase-like HAD superfamily hydrolase
MSAERNIKVIVLDFDGVIVDSEQGKRDAWQGLFTDSPDPWGFSWSGINTDELVGEAMQKWIHGSAAGSRYEIISHVMDAAQYPKSEDRIREYANRYDARVQTLVRHTGISKETESALASLSQLVPLYLNSATPEDNLRESVRTLGISGYFKDVLGKSPGRYENSKIENLRIASSREGVPLGNVLYVGDAESDFRAAEKAGSQFVRFTGFPQKNLAWILEAPHSISHLSELHHFLV